MNNNLDVWAIQNAKEDLEVALANIKTDNDIILFTNLLCDFNIGNRKIREKSFDTALYSEENDILVLLMNGGVKTANDIRAYLDNKDLDYNEVVFAKGLNNLKSETVEIEEDVPEIWFAKDQAVLEAAFIDSAKKDMTNECEYYPFMTGNLNLNYKAEFQDEFKDEFCQIAERVFQGVIKMNDKIILLIKNSSQNSITASDIKEKAEKYGINLSILEDTDFNITSNKSNKKLIKDKN